MKKQKENSFFLAFQRFFCTFVSLAQKGTLCSSQKDKVVAIAAATLSESVNQNLSLLEGLLHLFDVFLCLLGEVFLELTSSITIGNRILEEFI